MRRIAQFLVIIVIILMGGLNNVSAQEPIDFEGPKGFQWISTPEPTECTPVNQGALVLGDPTGVIDAEEHNVVVQFANPDPEWTDYDGNVITQIFIYFEAGRLYTSNILIPAHIWYFGTECSINDGMLWEEFLQPFMDNLELQGESTASFDGSDVYNNPWIQEIFNDGLYE